MDKDRLEKLIEEVTTEKNTVSNYPITKTLCGYLLELTELLQEVDLEAEKKARALLNLMMKTGR